MIINWLGHSCFKIKTRPDRGEEVTILMDPFDESIGLKAPKAKADIVTISHNHHDHSNRALVSEGAFCVDSPGEYSIKNVIIEGFESFHDKNKGAEKGRNTIFTIESEGIKICHLGDIGHVLDDAQIDSLGDIDILMIPVGGKYTIDAKEAEEIIGQLEPRIILPMHYKTENLTVDIDSVDTFLKEFGAEVKTPLDKFTVKAKDLEEVENEVVLLEISK